MYPKISHEDFSVYYKFKLHNNKKHINIAF